METVLAYIIFFVACIVLLGQVVQVTMFTLFFRKARSTFGEELGGFPFSLVMKAPLMALVPFVLFYFGISAAAIKVAMLCWPLL